jgi:glycine hydroxymethyltransferase
MGYLHHYFSSVPEASRTSAAIAFMASLDAVTEAFPLIGQSILKELKDQRSYLKLIASENFSSLSVQLAMGNLLTDKYSEGYVAHRFYAGCENVDTVEGQAVDLAKKLFGADHAYVQPHSGADANMVAFWSILVHKVQNKEMEALGKKNIDELSPEEYERVRQLLVNQKMMGLSLGSGGHLTHGFRRNNSAKMMRSVSYEVDPVTGLLDYAALSLQVKKEKPLLLIAGYSAYPRLIDFAKMREIADSVGAVLMVDMAHFAGLVAGKVMQGNYNPIPFAHVVTSTTHKTLRGPRGGLILCKEEYREAIDRGCPLVLGGPLPHVMAAKALAFKEALAPSFADYAHQVVQNAKALAEEWQRRGARVLTGGTDNHLLLIDVTSSFGLSGLQTEALLREAHMTVNRNSIPRDPQGAWHTSGIRMGTPAMTTLGMKEEQMREIASIGYDLLKEAKSETKTKASVPQAVLDKAKKRVAALLKNFPLYPELVIDKLDEKEHSTHNEDRKMSLEK